MDHLREFEDALLASRVASKFAAQRQDIHEAIKILKSLKVGDRVKIETQGKRDKIVQVTSVDETSYTYSAYVSSGQVRPGHISGGCLAWRKNDMDSLEYQPTMQQQTVAVDRISKV